MRGRTLPGIGERRQRQLPCARPRLSLLSTASQSRCDDMSWRAVNKTRVRGRGQSATCELCAVSKGGVYTGYWAHPMQESRSWFRREARMESRVHRES